VVSAGISMGIYWMVHVFVFFSAHLCYSKLKVFLDIYLRQISSSLAINHY